MAPRKRTRTAKKPPEKRKKPPALKTPLEGDNAALSDLREQRELLKKRLKSRKISARDLATLSAELRKVNASISIVDGAKSGGGIEEEDLAARAARVRERLLKTKNERDRLALVPAPMEEVEDNEARAAP